ncbi:MAG TPA: hypothetical protein VHQ01_04820, partial [Pyrinomonadaceae bacterium]|nr:hypothetical protein [Pyrinomonadaceae bacterium]
MTAWSPGAEALSPFDEEGELKDDIPQELASFLQQFDVQKVFKVNIKKWNNENYAGRPTNPLPTFEGVIPTNEAVVGACGPAYYGFEVQWTPKDGKPRSEIYKIAL